MKVIQDFKQDNRKSMTTIMPLIMFKIVAHTIRHDKLNKIEHWIQQKQNNKTEKNVGFQKQDRRKSYTAYRYLLNRCPDYWPNCLTTAKSDNTTIKFFWYLGYYQLSLSSESASCLWGWRVVLVSICTHQLTHRKGELASCYSSQASMASSN